MVVERDEKKREALNAASDHHYFYPSGVYVTQIIKIIEEWQCSRG